MSIKIRGGQAEAIEHPTSGNLGRKKCDQCEHLYYNVIIPHRIGEVSTRAVYRKNNTEPILDNPRDYNVSIARFSIGTNQIPILVAPFADPQTVPGELVYKVTLVNNGNIETAPVIATQVTSGGFITNFYFTYSKFLKEVNTALETAFNNLSNNYGVPVGSEKPYITFNQAQNVFTIHAQTAHYDDALPDADRIDIFFNNEMLQLLFFENNYFGTGFNGDIDLLARINFYDKFNNINGAYYENVQDYSILSTWNSFKSLQIVSNLPIQNEFTENNYETVQSGLTTSQNILKDFIVLYGGDEVARTTVDYTVDEYEYIDLKGVEPLRNIEISIFWVDTRGRQYPLRLGPGESAQIKLLFKKKDITY